MSDYSWTQPVCDDCWDAEHPAKRSPRHRMGDREVCCRCGEATVSGIYIRVDPATVEHPTNLRG
jgi:hypothetical protein